MYSMNVFRVWRPYSLGAQIKLTCHGCMFDTLNPTKQNYLNDKSIDNISVYLVDAVSPKQQSKKHCFQIDGSNIVFTFRNIVSFFWLCILRKCTIKIYLLCTFISRTSNFAILFPKSFLKYESEKERERKRQREIDRKREKWRDGGRAREAKRARESQR